MEQTPVDHLYTFYVRTGKKHSYAPATQCPDPALAYPSLGANADREDNPSPTISREAEEPCHRLSSAKNRTQMGLHAIPWADGGCPDLR